jgi:hypothetical protein
VNKTEFDWAEHFGSATFEEIRKLSPDLSARRYPTTYWSDRDLLSLSSIDEVVQTADHDDLKRCLDSVDAKHLRARRNISSHTAEYVARVDFFELCNLLPSCAEDSEKYLDPERLLADFRKTS